MRTVVEIVDWGAPPVTARRQDSAPSPGDVVVRLLAAAINPVDIAIASGRFYGDVPALPFIAGAEAVGEVIAGSPHLLGRRVWCLATSGCFATEFAIPASRTIIVPEGVDDATAVALGIGGLPGWMGVRERGALGPGETVLVLGCGGAVGQVAIHAARESGAGRVVGAARSASGRQRALDRGADTVVDLGTSGDLVAELRDACGGGADLVIDPLWGAPALAALAILRPDGRLVQIGNAAGPTAEIPAGTLRGGRLDIRGYSVFREPFADLGRAYAELVAVARRASGPLAEIHTSSLNDAARAWARQRDGADGVKQVLVTD
jgi:NADPH:quinone reductase